MNAPDATAFDRGSVLVVYPRNNAAWDWLTANAEWPEHQRRRARLICDHRYGPELLGGMLAAGLHVTLDGRQPHTGPVTRDAGGSGHGVPATS